MMNLDFILFTPPSTKHNLLDFWGEAIFIPVFKDPSKSSQKSAGESLFQSLLNCYQPSKCSDAHTTVDGSILYSQGLPQLDINSLKTQESGQGFGNICKKSDYKVRKAPKKEYLSSKIKEGEALKALQIERYIPCLFLNSMVKSNFVLIYFHASGEDVKLCYKLLDFIRNSFQINVLAMEYPGYSINPGKPCSERIRQDAQLVYQHVVQRLQFKEEHIIVMGRSIGTGIALELVKGRKIASLVLISPFSSVKALAHQFVGRLGHFLVKQTYNNQQNIKDVLCPVFFLHGLKDALISHQNSLILRNECKKTLKTTLRIPKNMSHSSFDFYADLIDPLREFLIDEIGLNLYQQNMNGPQLPSELFHFPAGWKQN